MPAKLTIIIPTHEPHRRHDVLLRSIDYYKHFNCNVFIADSSAREFDYEFPDNVIYRHLPGLSLGKKLFEVAKDTTTPYVCLSADDDYLLESSLQVGARFLDDNLDYVSVQGRYLKFKLIGNQVIFSPRESRQSSHMAITSEDRFSRIVRTYNPYMWHWYAIHRTDLFIKSVQLSPDTSATDRFTCKITEFTQPLVPMCYGKHRVLPILWMARDSYAFDSEITLAEQRKVGSVAHSYKSINRVVNNIKKILYSEDCIV